VNKTSRPDAYAEFFARYPQYRSTLHLDALRAVEYGRLDEQAHVYLDYTGASLHAASQVRQHADLLNTQALGNPHSASPSSSRTTTLVEGAAGIVLVTPVYNASYTGVLKAFLDLLPRSGLRGKVALPLAVGGTVAHMLVLDYALRPVLASMGTPHIIEGVFVLDKWIGGHDSGELAIDHQVAERLRHSLFQLGRAVNERASTGARPYQAIV